MPILMIALIALVAFGLIGFLLAAAVVCESKNATRIENASQKTPSTKPAA